MVYESTTLGTLDITEETKSTEETKKEVLSVFMIIAIIVLTAIVVIIVVVVSLCICFRNQIKDFLFPPKEVAKEVENTTIKRVDSEAGSVRTERLNGKNKLKFLFLITIFIQFLKSVDEWYRSQSQDIETDVRKEAENSFGFKAFERGFTETSKTEEIIFRNFV